MFVVVVAFFSGITTVTAVTTLSASPSIPEPPGVPNQVSGIITPRSLEFLAGCSEVSEPQGHSESSNPSQVPVLTPIVTGLAGARPAGGIPVSTQGGVAPHGELPVRGGSVSTAVGAAP